MATMDAVRFNYSKRTLDLAKISRPIIQESNEILIRIVYAGVCGTDMRILNGEYPCRQSGEITLGHEISGVILEVGHDVIYFEVGDKVTINPNRGCKRCAYCHAGHPHYCKSGCTSNAIGLYKDGGWAQYIVCAEEQVFKLGKTVKMLQGVLTEPLSCIIHGWDVISPLSVGSKILVTGAGFYGALWVSVLHLHGLRNVTVSEPCPSRLNYLRRMNTGYILLTPEDLRRRSEEKPEDFLFDAAIDTSGCTAAIEQGISLLNSGGKFLVFGVTPKFATIQVSPLEIFWKELKILGSRINPFAFPKAIALTEILGNRYLNYNNLGVKIFPLSEYQEAVDAMKRGDITKAIFKI